MNTKTHTPTSAFDIALFPHTETVAEQHNYAQMSLTHLKNTNLYFVHYQDKAQGISFKRFISKEEYEQRAADFEMAVSNGRIEYYTRLV